VAAGRMVDLAAWGDPEQNLIQPTVQVEVEVEVDSQAELVVCMVARVVVQGRVVTVVRRV